MVVNYEHNSNSQIIFYIWPGWHTLLRDDNKETQSSRQEGAKKGPEWSNCASESKECQQRELARVHPGCMWLLHRLPGKG